jgi:hypothetical protein
MSDTDLATRDIIDVTIPTPEDHLAAHREYCRSVIAARVPEVSEDEIADAAFRLKGGRRACEARIKHRYGLAFALF